MAYLQLFVYLQLLDLMTTLVGFRLGGVEVSPFAHWMTGLGPTTGILLVKVIALCIAGICLRCHRARVIAWSNYFFAMLVVWNLGQIWKAVA